MFSALICGTLAADPARREGTRAPFATGHVRVQPPQGDPFLASIIGFGERADELLRLAKGTAISVSGRASLSSWTGTDGVERHGLKVIVDQIAALAPKRTAARHAPHRTASMYPPPNRMKASSPLADDVSDLWRDGPP
jgi:single-stranded DNA-binding protein